MSKVEWIDMSNVKKLPKSVRKVRNHFFETAQLEDFRPNIGKKCHKTSRPVTSQPKNFKSGSKINTIKDVVIHPILWEPAYTFEEDDSYVACRTIEIVDEPQWTPILESIHDVLVEIENRTYSTKECEVAYNSLPDNIKGIAVRWCANDTVFRDEAFAFLKKKHEKTIVFDIECINLKEKL